MNHDSIFTSIYETNEWGTREDISTEFKGNSGQGSAVECNLLYIYYLKYFILMHGITSVVDVGCGDWRCGTSIYGDLRTKGVKYCGYDVYDAMVQHHQKHYADPLWTFSLLNCAANPGAMASADLLILKDVLQHWTDDEATKFLDYVIASKKYKYVLITNCAHRSQCVSLENAGGYRPLPRDGALFKGYPFEQVLAYNNKAVLLLTCHPL